MVFWRLVTFYSLPETQKQDSSKTDLGKQKEQNKTNPD